MKANRKDILALIVGLLALLLLITLVVRRKAPESVRNEATDVRDTLIKEDRRALKADTAELLRRDDSIRAAQQRNREREKAQAVNREKQQTLKKQSEAIKKHIDSDGFDRDSLRRALSEFQD